MFGTSSTFGSHFSIARSNRFNLKEGIQRNYHKGSMGMDMVSVANFVPDLPRIFLVRIRARSSPAKKVGTLLREEGCRTGINGFIEERVL